MLTKTISILFSGLIMALVLSCATTPPVKLKESQLAYPYTKLKLLDLDQMSELVQNKLRLYKKANRIEFALEAIKICLSRPNGDGLAEKIIDNIRFNLDSEEIWEKAVLAVVRNAVDELKSETASGEDQLTYLILLENLVLEFKPEFVRQYESPKFETKVVEQIAGANIKISAAAASESRLNLMMVQKSPSALAQILIDSKTQKLNTKNKTNK